MDFVLSTNERDFPVSGEPRPVGVAAHLRGEIMAIVTVGIDLTKNVFAVHGVDEAGEPAPAPITGAVSFPSLGTRCA